jgi:flagellar basal-body rod protein FlgC
MGMDLNKSMMISAAGMKAQSVRMRVITENLANADTTPAKPGDQPYRRKSVTFQNALDQEMGTETVKIGRVTFDKSPFGKVYRPGDPGADKEGYVQTPNVNTLLEVMDMHQAQRTYEANLKSSEVAKNMIMRTLDLLR